MALLRSTLAVFLFALAACGGTQATDGEGGEGDPAQNASEQSGSLDPGSLKLHEGFSRIENSCATDAKERCNGADDNCNGQIDETCGLKQGALHIALTWNSDADLNLYVIDPQGETLSQQHRETAAGGHLQHDGRGACSHQKMQRVESAYFEGPLRPGTYVVEVAYWGECAASGLTTASLSIADGTKLHGVFNGDVSPGERRSAVTFSVSQ